MNDSDFEKHLQRQPLRRIPQEWRSEILQNAAASAPSTLDRRPSFLSTINHQLSTILWPNPKAWAVLAAVWVAIFVLHFSSKENLPRMAARAPGPSPEMIAELRQQQKELAELIGPSQPNDAERPKQFSPRPHSERRETNSMA